MSFHLDPRHQQAYLKELETSVRSVRLVAPKRRPAQTPEPAQEPLAAP
ncbi:MAG: hypothetical protein HKN63_05055 [Rhodobacteraceae bacterium]|nr:hypothetical protein [Paracoccaceae bacterium]